MEQFQQNVKDVLARLSAIRIVPVLVLDNLEDGLKMCSVLQEKNRGQKGIICCSTI